MAALGGLSPLLAIPAVTARFGAGGWSAIAMGQSFGTAAATIVSLGWPVVGPPWVARASRGSHRGLLMRALRTQSVAGLLAVPPITLTAMVVAPEHALALGLTTCAAASIGLAPSWYFVGTSAPLKLMRYVALPQVLGAALGSLLLLRGAALAALPIAQLCCSALGLLLAYRHEQGTSSGCPTIGRVVAPRLRAAAGTQALSMVYLNLPVALFGTFTTAGLAEFAAADRIYRLVLTALAPLTQVFQGSVASGEPVEQRQRMLQSLAAHVGLGSIAAAGALWFMLGPAPLLFSETVRVSAPVAAVYSFSIVVVSVTRCLGLNVLAVMGRTGPLAASAAVGALLALVLLPLAAVSSGAVGAASAVLFVESTVLAVQAAAARSLFTSGRAGAAHRDVDHQDGAR